MAAKMWTKEQVTYLTENYNKLSVERLQRNLPYTCKQIKGKAKRLRLGKNHDWTEAEKLLLEELAESMPFNHLIKAYNNRAKLQGLQVRTPSAIRHMLNKLGFSRSPQVDCYKAATLASTLGISEGPVTRWIKQGLLKAERQGDSERSHFIIYRSSLVRFALTNPDEISSLNLDKSAVFWLLSEIAATPVLRIRQIPGSYVDAA